MNATTSRAAGGRPRHPAARRAIAGTGAVIAAIGAAALTGCAASSPPPSAAGSPANGPGAPASALATAGAVPVLGRLAGAFPQGQGFGQVKPATIFNGGDPTGLVTSITWNSWGGPQATGSGMSDYVGAGQSVATGTQKPVTVVAFKLGSCHGTLMYKAVEWYFPGEGQTFSPHQYQNICTGSYVPGP